MRRRSIGILALVAVLAGAAAADDEPRDGTALLEQGDRAFRAREYTQATALYEQAASAAERAGATETRVEALAMAARGYLIREQKDAGRPFLARAGKLASDAMPRGWSRYLGVLGRFHWKDGDKPKATRVFERMYAFCMRHDLHARAVDAAHMVAITGTKAQQLAWARKGIAAAEKGKMDGWLGPLWNNLGITYHEMGDDEKALEAYKKARHYHWKVGGETSKLAADWAVGTTLRSLGRYKEARTWMRPVLAWAERRHAEIGKAETHEWVGLALLEVGLLAKAQGDARGARRDLERAEAILAKRKMAEWHPELWKEMQDALAALRGAAAAALRQAASQMRSLAEAIDLHRLTYKKLPGALEDLTKTDGRHPRPFVAAIPQDPWGRPYAYRVLDRRRYELRSAGPDGRPGTEDDLTHP